MQQRRGNGIDANAVESFAPDSPMQLLQEANLEPPQADSSEMSDASNTTLTSTSTSHQNPDYPISSFMLPPDPFCSLDDVRTWPLSSFKENILVGSTPSTVSIAQASPDAFQILGLDSMSCGAGYGDSSLRSSLEWWS